MHENRDVTSAGRVIQVRRGGRGPRGAAGCGMRHGNLRASVGRVLLVALLAALAGCESDSWRPLTRAQRAERRLDFAVHVDQGDAMVRRFEEFLRDPQPPPDPDRRMNWRGLRRLLHSWREPAERRTDQQFRMALQRAAELGTPLVIAPVSGDQFPVQVLYFGDETFLLVDRVEERHLLFRCLLDDREVIATGTRHPWHPRISGPGDADLSIRVYVFFGYDSPDRSTRMTPQHLAECIGSFADNSHRVRRRVGDDEQQRVQQVHDLFFQVTR